MGLNRKTHWDNIYDTKGPRDISWTQETPDTSLAFIRQFKLPKSAHILDVGGGDSKLVDHLLAQGFNNITVLDISEKALEKTKARLGRRADDVRWLITDILDFDSNVKYDLWHDRATFHFLTEHNEIKKYIDIAIHSVNSYMTIATFSEKGPEKCSGLKIVRYSEQSLQEELSKGFQKIRCLTEDHITPFNTRQNFLFCSYKRVPI